MTEPTTAKIGDRVRSKAYRGVSGVVESIEEKEDGRLIYRTAKGWWHADEVTIEPSLNGSGKP